MIESSSVETTPIVYVIDDDRSVRVSLEDLLASVGLRVRTFGSTREFLDQPRENVPGCLVLDIRMPEQSGMDFHRQMNELGIRLPVVFITGHGDIAMSVEAMKNGAIEFLTKPFRDQDLLDAIQHGIEQDQRQRQEDRANEVLRKRWQSLSEGEKKVLEGVVRGRLNKQIAADLGLSEITVKVRRAHVMQKMQAKTLVDLVRMYDRIAS